MVSLLQQKLIVAIVTYNTKQCLHCPDNSILIVTVNDAINSFIELLADPNKLEMATRTAAWFVFNLHLHNTFWHFSYGSYKQDANAGPVIAASSEAEVSRCQGDFGYF